MFNIISDLKNSFTELSLALKEPMLDVKNALTIIDLKLNSLTRDSEYAAIYLHYLIKNNQAEEAQLNLLISFFAQKYVATSEFLRVSFSVLLPIVAVLEKTTKLLVEWQTISIKLRHDITSLMQNPEQLAELSQQSLTKMVDAAVHKKKEFNEFKQFLNALKIPALPGKDASIVAQKEASEIKLNAYGLTKLDEVVNALSLIKSTEIFTNSLLKNNDLFNKFIHFLESFLLAQKIHQEYIIFYYLDAHHENQQIVWEPIIEHFLVHHERLTIVNDFFANLYLDINSDELINLNNLHKKIINITSDLRNETLNFIQNNNQPNDLFVAIKEKMIFSLIENSDYFLQFNKQLSSLGKNQANNIVDRELNSHDSPIITNNNNNLNLINRQITRAKRDATQNSAQQNSSKRQTLHINLKSFAPYYQDIIYALTSMLRFASRGTFNILTASEKASSLFQEIDSLFTNLKWQSPFRNIQTQNAIGYFFETVPNLVSIPIDPTNKNKFLQIIDFLICHSNLGKRKKNNEKLKALYVLKLLLSLNGGGDIDLLQQALLGMATLLGIHSTREDKTDLKKDFDKFYESIQPHLNSTKLTFRRISGAEKMIAILRNKAPAPAWILLSPVVIDINESPEDTVDDLSVPTTNQLSLNPSSDLPTSDNIIIRGDDTLTDQLLLSLGSDLSKNDNIIISGDDKFTALSSESFSSREKKITENTNESSTANLWGIVPASNNNNTPDTNHNDAQELSNKASLYFENIILGLASVLRSSSNKQFLEFPQTDLINEVSDVFKGLKHRSNKWKRVKLTQCMQQAFLTVPDRIKTPIGDKNKKKFLHIIEFILYFYKNSPALPTHSAAAARSLYVFKLILTFNGTGDIDLIQQALWSIAQVLKVKNGDNQANFEKFYEYICSQEYLPEEPKLKKLIHIRAALGGIAPEWIYPMSEVALDNQNNSRTLESQRDSLGEVDTDVLLINSMFALPRSSQSSRQPNNNNNSANPDIPSDDCIGDWSLSQ